MIVNSRKQKAFNLRKSGLTYKQIGQELCVGAQQARTLVFQHKRFLRKTAEGDEFSGLPDKVARVLQAELGFNITKNDIKNNVIAGLIFPGFAPFYGQKTHLLVLQWLGMPETDTSIMSMKAVPQYIEYLQKRGYKVTAPEKKHE